MSITKELEKLIVKIVGDLTQYKKDIAEAINVTAAGAKTMGAKLQGIGKGVSLVGVGMTAGVTAPVIALGASLIKLAADAETTTVQFKTMLGEVQGLKMMKDLTTFSAATPFSAIEVLGAGRTLLAFGVEQEKMMGTMKVLGDISAGTGKNFKELAVIFGQIRGLGRLMAQDFNQLVSAGLPVTELAKTMGVEMKNFKDEMEKGNVTFEVVEETFRRITSEGGKFANMMEKLSATTAGRWSTLMDNVQILGAKLGSYLLPAANKLMDWLSAAVQWFDRLNPGIQAIIGAFLTVAAVVGPVLIVLGGLIASIGFIIGGIGAAVIGITVAAAAVGSFGALLAVVVVALGIIATMAVVATPVIAVIGSIIGAIITFGAIIVGTIAKSTLVRIAFSSLFSSIAKLGGKVGAALMQLWGPIKALGVYLGEMLAPAVAYITLMVANFIDTLADFDIAGFVRDTVVSVLQSLGLVYDILTNLPGLLSNGFEGIGIGIVQTLWEVTTPIAEIVSSVASTILGGATTIVNGLVDMWDMVPAIFGGPSDDMVSKVKKDVAALADTLKKAVAFPADFGNDQIADLDKKGKAAQAAFDKNWAGMGGATGDRWAKNFLNAIDSDMAKAEKDVPKAAKDEEKKKALTPGGPGDKTTMGGVIDSLKNISLKGLSMSGSVEEGQLAEQKRTNSLLEQMARDNRSRTPLAV